VCSCGNESFGFHERLDFCRLLERLSASQIGLNSMELVSYLVFV
jgi:hypothetical protein